MKTEAEKQAEGDRIAAAFKAALDKMGREVRFSQLRRYPSGAMFREVVWFQGSGWDLVRSGKGDWAGLPTSAYQHPPLLGRVMQNDRKAAILSLLEVGGFFLPAEHPYAQGMDAGLRARGLITGPL